MKRVVTPVGAAVLALTFVASLVFPHNRTVLILFDALWITFVISLTVQLVRSAVTRHKFKKVIASGFDGGDE